MADNVPVIVVRIMPTFVIVNCSRGVKKAVVKPEGVIMLVKEGEGDKELVLSSMVEEEDNNDYCSTSMYLADC
jgi:hypothetical protein